MAAHAAERPDATAMVAGPRRLSYAALDRLVDRAASGFQRRGLEPGDVVALLGVPAIEHLALHLGALRAGLAVAPLADWLTRDALVRMLDDAGAKLLLTDAAGAGRLAPMPSTLEYDVLTESGGREPLEVWSAISDAPAPVSIAPDQAFNIIYTSGTTETPRGIVVSHAMRWHQSVRREPLGDDAVLLISTPLYASATIINAFMGLAFGAAVVVLERFDPARFLAVAERERATQAMLAPVQYRRVLGRPEFDDADLSSFRLKTCTSAPCPPALAGEILRRWPGAFIQYYGLSEGGPSCVLRAHERPDKLHTVGLPAPNCDIRILGEGGTELAAGAVGEVVGRSPWMMSAYHGQPEKTAQAEWFDPGGARFIRSGDLGYFDPDGFLVLVDRAKDLIITGGLNVYPSDLEAVLSQHGGVEEAAVVGQQSDQFGERPVAFVTPRSGHLLDDRALLTWANSRLGKAQRLSSVRIVAQLPRSPVGKVLKRELRAQLVQSA
ncbi:MAG TPA: class I adenylate-forming enzyme family protein [Caulobacteraceae bacterium]|nr:class I adenylate-forming enzyme family protein [Caulobacteraceae bacterium]